MTDKQGGDDVTFTKKIDNEVITVVFSISDLRSEEPMEEEEEGEDMPEPAQMSMATVTVTKVGGPSPPSPQIPQHTSLSCLLLPSAES